MKFFNRNPQAVIYCAEPVDYVTLKPVLKYLPALPVVAKNRKTKEYLKNKGIEYKCMPSFPEAVIMSRHAAHKFPEEKIIKIGFRHGAYHFKAFAGAQYYNMFDLFFVTGNNELDLAEKHGITTAKAIGFPKLDPAFNNAYNDEILKIFINKANIDYKKGTVIFTATWDKSGMSAIDKWIEIIHTLTERYNILVTVHPWTSKKYIEKLREIEDLYFINEPDVLPYLLIADVLVGDTSSIIAEFCALDKPIIVFKTSPTKRTVDKITCLLEDIAYRIDGASQLDEAIEYSLKNPKEKSTQRQKANKIMFDVLDGKAGKRAAEVILEMLPQLLRCNLE